MGLNPGIVNALAFMALTEFANRVGVAATVDALELVGVLITEEDTTVEQNAFESPDCLP